MSEQRQKWTIYACDVCGEALIPDPWWDDDEHPYPCNSKACLPETPDLRPVEVVPASLLSESQAEVGELTKEVREALERGDGYLRDGRLVLAQLDEMRAELAESQARERQLADALKLAHGCLLEVRQDFNAPVSYVIAEVREALSETGER